MNAGNDSVEKAYERALNLLDKRARTEWEIKDRLLRAGFSEELALKTLDRLRGAGLVDDEDYAQRYMEALAGKGQGKLRIAAAMRQKGIPEELLRNTLEDGLLHEDEYARAKDAAQKSFSAIPEGTDSRKAASKVSRRLVTLGFSYDIIGEVINDLKLTNETG